MYQYITLLWVQYVLSYLFPISSFDFRQLPIVDDEVMLAIGRHCHSLEHLDISYNRDVTGRGLGYLVPKKEDGGGGSDDPHRGCPNLLRLHMFDTLVNQKDVAEVGRGSSICLCTGHLG